MFIVTVDIEKCQGCGDCVEVCPMQGIILLTLEEGGDKKYAAYTAAPDECLGCLACQEGCPEGAVAVVEM